jgi:hypothetical protein
LHPLIKKLYQSRARYQVWTEWWDE